MYHFEPFQQEALLKQRLWEAHHLGVQNGVCVAICDYWLALIKNKPGQSAAERMAYITQNFNAVMYHQNSYLNLRQSHGRNQARKMVGGSIGLDYDMDKTMIMRRFMTMDHIAERIKNDVKVPGDAATWSLRFPMGGHAIAGFCNIVGQDNIHRIVVHIFDPNYGECQTTTGNVVKAVKNLLQANDMYRSTTHVFRAGEG